MSYVASHSYGRMASLKRADDFAAYIERLGLALDFDRELLAGERAPLGQPYSLGEQRILHLPPVLDPKFGIEPGYPCLTDGEIDKIIEDFVRAAVRAQAAGFAFVDIKHCHGYLGHEFLSARRRPGRYGGTLENRTRFLTEIVRGVRRDAPGLLIGVRLSAFDLIPFRMGSDRRGEPEEFTEPYHWCFGGAAANPPRGGPTQTILILD